MTTISVTSNGPVDVVSEGRIQILDNGQLLITTTVSTDSGHYMCNASNSRGSQTAEAFLEVYGKDNLWKCQQIGHLCIHFLCKNIYNILYCKYTIWIGVSYMYIVCLSIVWKWSFISMLPPDYFRYNMGETHKVSKKSIKDVIIQKIDRCLQF